MAWASGKCAGWFPTHAVLSDCETLLDRYGGTLATSLLHRLALPRLRLLDDNEADLLDHSEQLE